MNEQEVTLRISGNTCEGEYCLNIGAASTAVVFNLGKPDGMMDSSLLKAAAGHTYIRLDPNTAYVAGLEAALRPETSHGERKDHSRIGHWLAEGSWHVHLAGFCCEGDAERFLAVALSARPDAPDTRVVTVDQLELWASEWEKTVSMAHEYCAIDKKMIDEIRAIIGDVK